MNRPTAIFIIFLLFTPCIPAAGDWQTLQNTATSLYQQGDYAQAAVYLQQAIARAEQADNGDKFKVSSLNLLAFVYLATGDQQRAITTLEQAIIIARKVYPNSHPTLAIMLFNTGDFLEQAGQADQALLAYQAAWAIQRQDVVKYADAALKTADALVAIHNRQQRYQRSVAIATTILAAYTNTKPTAFNESLRQISYALAQAQLQLHHRELAQQALAQQLRRDLDQDLKGEMLTLRKDMNKRFEQVDKRFEQVDKRFEQVDKRFEQVDKRFEQLTGRIDSFMKWSLTTMITCSAVIIAVLKFTT